MLHFIISILFVSADENIFQLKIRLTVIFAATGTLSFVSTRVRQAQCLSANVELNLQLRTSWLFIRKGKDALVPALVVVGNPTLDLAL